MCMRTGLGTHIVGHLLQGHCKMFSREAGYRGKSCAASRFGKTLKNVQVRAACLSSFHSSERNAWRPGRRENGGWVRRLKTSEFLPVVEHPQRHTHEPLLRISVPACFPVSVPMECVSNPCKSCACSDLLGRTSASLL